MLAEDGLKKGNEMNFKFEEVSAKSGENIQNVFKNITN